MKRTVCDIYNEISEWFDSARNKNLFEKQCLDFIQNKLPKNAHLLDLGCGTGQPIAEFFINNGVKITGIDGAENMIKLCAQRFPDHDWIVSDMRNFESNKTYDAILAWDSFFHLSREDQRLMFPRFKKLTHKGSILCFSCGSEEDECWSEMRGPTGTDMLHASLNTQEYKNLLHAHGFNILKEAIEDKNCGGHTYFIAQKNH